MTGLVFDIQRFCTHDGPGIRTTVFLKGCPLRCAWCHNPEAQRQAPDLFFTPSLCLACGACIEACPSGAHTLDAAGPRDESRGWEAFGQPPSGRSGTDATAARQHEPRTGPTPRAIWHTLDRALCRLCLRCAEACPSRALEAAGAEMSVDAVMVEVNSDRVFYVATGGGLTVSGGEPLTQAEFARALLLSARAGGIHTCVETSGAGPDGALERVLPVTDLFLWDVKDTDPERHLANTGAPLEPLLDRLRSADTLGAHTVLRCVLIAGVNVDDAHADRLADLHAGLRHCQGMELLPYHPLGQGKLQRLGLPAPALPMATPTEEEMAAFGARLAARGVPVERADG